MRKSTSKSILFTVEAGVFSALLATAVSAFMLMLVFVRGYHLPITLRAGLRYVVLTFALCAATAPFAASFGFVGGCLLGAWLVLRLRKAPSTARLVVECGLAGMFLGLAFSKFHLEMYRFALAMWRTGRISASTLRYVDSWPAFLSGEKERLFALSVAVPCALLVGVVFARLGRKQVEAIERCRSQPF